LSSSICQALYYNFSLTDDNPGTVTTRKSRFIQVQLGKIKEIDFLKHAGKVSLKLEYSCIEHKLNTN
jgi:hypothetical protein